MPASEIDSSSRALAARRATDPCPSTAPTAARCAIAGSPIASRFAACAVRRVARGMRCCQSSSLPGASIVRTRSAQLWRPQRVLWERNRGRTCSTPFPDARSARGRHGSQTGRRCWLWASPAWSCTGEDLSSLRTATRSCGQGPPWAPPGGPASIGTPGDRCFHPGGSPAGSPAASSCPPAWICHGLAGMCRPYRPEVPDRGLQRITGLTLHSPGGPIPTILGQR